MRFERNVNSYFPEISRSTVTSGCDAGRRYRLVVDVPHYEARHVEILFQKQSPKVPRVKVDGPKESKHRYPGGYLCMWYKDDPLENRWDFDDGLLALIIHIIAHLFREAWWRETGEWLGPEIEHSPILLK